MVPAALPMGWCDAHPIFPTCVIGKVPGAIAASGFESMATSLGDGYVQMLKMVTTFWVKINVGTLDANPDGVIVMLRDVTWWWLLVIACVGAIIGATKLAINQDAREGQLIFKGLVRTVLVAGGGVAVINLLSVSSDKTSSWIIEQAMAAHPDQGFSLFLGGSALTQLTPGILFLVALFGILASMAQLILLVFRAAFVTVMAGILPLAAASSVTSAGIEWFNRLAGYTLAAIAYKPVAALIYAAAFKLMGSSSGPLGVLEGLAMVILAILALPSMMRLFVPAMGAASAGASGMFGAGIGAAAVAAQGANVLTGHTGGGTSSSTPAAPQGASMAQSGPKALSGGGAETTAATGTSGPASAAGAAGSGAATAGSATAAGASAGTTLVVTESFKAAAGAGKAVQQSAKDVTGDEQ